jgi:subtilase family serine protease
MKNVVSRIRHGDDVGPRWVGLEPLEPRILLSGVDFTVTSATAPPTHTIPATFTVNWTSKNQGDVDWTTNITDVLYYSTDPVFDAADKYLTQAYVTGGLDAGEERAMSKSVTLNISTPTGPGYILAVADGRINSGIIETNETNNAYAIPINVFPPDVDLQVTGTNAPTLAFQSQSIEISCTATNTGSETATANWYDSVYLSSDAVLDAGDVRVRYLSVSSVSPLDGGEAYIRTSNITLPSDASLGASFLLFAVDYRDGASYQGETDETNNITARPINILAPDVDFQVTSAASPPTAPIGGPVNVSWTVQNFGAEDTTASRWYDHVYCSQDTVLDAGDQRLRTKSFTGPLTAGNDYTVTDYQVWLPTDAAAGDYDLLFVADGANDQSETSETNNVYSRPITLFMPDVDLTIDSVTAPSSGVSDTEIDFSWIGRNIGGAATTGYGWYDTIYFSMDDQYDEFDDWLAYDYESGPVGAGDTYELSGSGWLPTAPLGPAYLLFVVDSDLEQPETEEANNVYAHPFTIRLPDRDLTITSVSAPSISSGGESFNVSWTAQNVGTDAVSYGFWYDKVFYSDDAVLDASDEEIASRARSMTLESGGEYNISNQGVTLPAGAASGQRYLLFATDYRDDEFESDETNNVYAHSILIDAADLTVSGPSAPATASAGDQISVSWTVANSGLGSAGDRSDGIYLSTNTTLDASDQLLDSIDQLGPLTPAGSYTINHMMNLSGDVLAGANYLLFVVDNEGDVPEINEDNNVVSAPISIDGSDLAVATAAVTPDPGPIGGTFQTSYTVINNGDAAASGSPDAGQGASGWYDAWYLSDDAILDGEDEFLLDRWVGADAPLAIGATYAVAIDVAVPDTSAGGARYLLLAIDYTQMQAEAGPGTNVFPVALTLEAPDLIVTGDTVPATAILSESIHLSWTVTNSGSVTAGADWRDNVYFLDHPTIEPGDTPQKFEDITTQSPLGAGSSYTINRNIGQPASVPGDYYLIFALDALGQQGETDESNNLRVVPITIVAPDLVVSTATAPASAATNGQINVSWTVTNQSAVDAPAGLWWDSIYLSEDPVLNWGDINMGAINQGANAPLVAGGSYVTNRSETIPQVDPGDYYLLFVVDRHDFLDTGVQGESDENNNVYALAITIEAPDLQVTDASAPLSAVPGQQVEVSWTVTNIGAVVASADWEDRIYISDFPDYDSGGRTMIDLQDVATYTPLAAGDSYVVTRNVTIPDVGDGAKYLHFRVDSNSRQGETDETNNIFSIPISLAAPNLTITAATVPSTAALGDSVSVSWTVANDGVSAAPSDWFDSVYLSIDTVWSVSDVLVDHENVSANTPLASGGDYTINRNIDIPNFAPGAAYLLFVVDGQQIQGETNEDDNVWAAGITLDAPDLQMTAATVPPTAIVNETINVSWTVTNQSAHAATFNWWDRMYISDDPILDWADDSLGASEQSAYIPLAGGSSYTHNHDITLPGDRTGQMYLLFVVDESLRQGETDKTNNVRAEAITIDAPDLEVTSFTAPATITLGSSATATFTVTNTGDVSAPGDWNDCVYLSDDAIFDSSDMRLFSQEADDQTPLAPGGSYVVSAGLTLDQYDTDWLGAKYLFFVTDRSRLFGYSQQGETDETNNTQVTPITVVAPDLRVTAVTGTSDAVLGQSIDVSWTVLNDSSVPAGADWRDQAYLSTSPTLDGTHVRIANEFIADQTPLAGGASYTVNATCTIEDFTPGNRYLVFAVNALGGQGESDASNNLHAIPITLVAPDLQIANITVEPAVGMQSGDSVIVRWETHNIGTGATQNVFSDLVTVFNTSTGLEMDSEYLFYIPEDYGNGPIEPGEFRSREAVVRLPNGPAGVGDMEFRVEIDNQDSIPEYAGEARSESNNIGSIIETSTLAPYPDLVVSNIVAPISALSGESPSISWTITNFGDRDTGSASGGSLGWHDRIYLSSDSTLGEDLFWGEFRYSGSLGPGQSVTRTQPMDLNINFSGDYYVVVRTEAWSKHYEYRIGVDAEGNNASIDDQLLSIDLAPMPNLQVTDIVEPTSPQSGQPTLIEWTVANTGDAGTGLQSWTDRVYLSTDETISNEDVFLGQVSNASYLDIGENYIASLTATLPHHAVGLRYLIVRTDIHGGVFEYELEADNSLASAGFVIELTPPPDLQVTSVSAPATGFSGQPLSVSYRITNAGVGVTPVSYWGDRIFISDDNVLDAMDRQVYSSVTHWGSLDAGEYYDAMVTVHLPEDWSGETWLIVLADRWNAVYEHGGEANNSGASTSSTNVVLVGADLEVVSVDAPATALASHNMDVSYIVKNFGTSDTTALYITDKFYLSTDVTFEESDIFLGDRRYRRTLAVDEDYIGSASVTLPDGLSGDFYLFVVTDASNKVFELDEDNNNQYDPAAILITSSPADLVVTSMTTESPVEYGGTMRVEWSVSNNGVGDTAVDQWSDRIYLSRDDTLGYGDKTLGVFNRSGTPMNPGQSYTKTQFVDIPTYANGDYFVLVVSDSEDKVYEAGVESNNLYALPVTVERHLPDLVITNITAPATANSGGTLTVSYEITNQGDGPTLATSVWHDAVTLVTVPVVGYGYNFEYVGHSRIVAPGESYIVTRTFDIPIDLQGTYYVQVRGDSGWDISEIDDDNNNTVRDVATVITLSPSPDLITPLVSVPTEVVAGQDLDVSWTVRNDGSGATEAGKEWNDAIFLSHDAVFDRADDIYLGYYKSGGGLGSGQSYLHTGALTVPSDMEGLFYVFVRADDVRRGTTRIHERDGEHNNVGMAPTPVLVSLAPPSDLVAGVLTVPANAQPGAEVSIAYSVDNQGLNDAIGNWYDSLYASTDGVWDIGDMLIGRVRHTDGVLAGESYSETYVGSLPGVLPGDYQVIVRTDIRNHVPEADESNNISASLDSVIVEAPSLELGVPSAGVLSPGQSAYYRVELSAGETLKLSLDSSSETGANELYIRFIDMPSRGVYDAAYEQAFEADQSLVIPETSSGTYYVMVHNRTGPTDESYTITAELLVFAVDSVTPGAVGNAGPSTLAVRGAIFEPDMSCELVGPGGLVLTAGNLHYADSTEVYPTFDLTDQPIGSYQLRMRLADGSLVTVDDAVSVAAGIGPRLEAGVKPMPRMLPRPFIISVEYENVGDADMIAPMLRLVAPSEVVFGLSHGASDGIGQISFLGWSPTGPAGVLRPGQRASVEFYVPAVEPGTYSMDLQAIRVDPNNPTPDLASWDSYGQNAPAIGSQDDWASLWSVFEAQVGSTWQEAIARMAENLTANPIVDDRPNILLDDLLMDMMIDSLDRGGGLTDQESPWALTHNTRSGDLGVTAVEMIFSETIDPASFTVDDVTLTGPDGPVAALTVNQISGRIYEISFPEQTTPGEYQLIVGPDIVDLVGYALDQDFDGSGGEGEDAYRAAFRIGPDGAVSDDLFITAHSPAGLRDQREGADHVIVNFSAPVHEGTFTAADVSITGPGGDITVSSVDRLSTTVYRVGFAAQDAVGAYSVNIGPDITAISGDAMAQAYVADFSIADFQGPSIAGHTPDSWIAEIVSEIEVTFSEAIDPATFDLGDIAITGPSGVVTPTGLVQVSDTVFRIELPDQSESQDYNFSIGPHISDLHGNEMDQDADGSTGGGGDYYTGEFHIPYGVHLTALGGAPQDGPVGAPPTQPHNMVTIEGRVRYAAGSDLARNFPDGPLVTVVLWEQDGERDVFVGRLGSPDPADDFVCVLNSLTGDGFTTQNGEYFFNIDINGDPLTSIDRAEYNVGGAAEDDPDDEFGNRPDAKYYVMAYTRNQYATLFDPRAGTGPAADAAAPWRALYWPESAPPPGKVQTAGMMHEEAVGTVTQTKPSEMQIHEHVNMGDGFLNDNVFGVTQWISYASQWILDNTGQPARRHISMLYPAVDDPVTVENEGDVNNAFFDPAMDVIGIGYNLISSAATFLHEYGHSLSYAYNSYAPFPYPIQDSYGVLQESVSTVVAYQEAWASFVAAKVLEDWAINTTAHPVTTGLRVPGDEIDRNRSGVFMETNQFWKGYDAHSLTPNQAHDSSIDSASYAKIDPSLINTNANTGDVVLGAIESIFWDLSDGGSGDDDGVNADIAGVWEAFRNSASFGNLDDFYYDYIVNRPGLARATKAIFIDHGVPEDIDDSWTESGGHSFGVLTAPTSLGELIMSDDAIGGGDIFTFSTPAQLNDSADVEEYSPVISVLFDEKYGDLDLVVDVADLATFSRSTHKSIKPGGNVASVKIPGLQTDTSYLFTVNVFGFGATTLGGSQFGGDFHPDYTLIIMPCLPVLDSDFEWPVDFDVITDLLIEIVAAFDPNDISGPEGFGEDRWIPADEAIDYVIRFENFETAGAWARKVVVTEQLDSDLDWRSFRVGDFGFGDVHVDVPDGRGFYSNRLDLRAEYGVYLDVVAGVDVATGLAFWELTAIDPDTGETPIGADEGFLPPNDADGIGEGFVNYTILASSSAITGDVIEAMATIVFDTESPLDTPPIFNTLDAESPIAAVDPLPTFSGEEFVVNWAPSDPQGGSGVAEMSLYVSEDDGPFAPWLEDTTLTQATYIGELGRTYAFYIRARDNAGNLGDAPTVPDAVTTIVDAATPEVVSIEINDGLLQRSRIFRIEAVFSGQVTVAAGDLVLHNDTTDENFDLSSEPFDEAAKTWDISGVALTDGRYTATLSVPGVEVHQFEFHVLMCDIDGDAEVGGGDYDTFVSQFGRSGSGLTADFNNDARVDLMDFVSLRANFGTTLPVPAPAPQAPAAVPTATLQATVEPTTETTAPTASTASQPLDNNDAEHDSIAIITPSPATDMLLESPLLGSCSPRRQSISVGLTASMLHRAAKTEYDLRPLSDDLATGGQMDDVLADILAESALVLPL